MLYEIKTLWWIYIIVLVSMLLIYVKVFLKLTTGSCKSTTCLVGKTVLITGGTSGIGYFTALHLASRGARVHLTTTEKNPEKHEKMRHKFFKETNNPNIIIHYVNLFKLKSVRKLVTKIKDTEKKLDILINNAGTINCGNQTTEDALQATMCVNHFAPFLLTVLLLDLLKHADGARIVFVSSISAFFYSIRNMQDLNAAYKFRYSEDTFRCEYRTYRNSKFCVVACANVLAQKLKPFNITVNSCHPGLTCTPFIAKAFRGFLFAPIIEMIQFIVLLFGKTAYEGAQTTLFLATAKEADNVTGQFFVDCRQFFQPAGDMNLNHAIWNESEKLVKLTPHERARITQVHLT